MEHFADNLKEICKILFGLTDEHFYGSLKDVIIEGHFLEDINGKTPRQIMQGFGTDVIRGNDMDRVFGFGEELWIKLLMNKIDANSNSNFVIADVRFQNEVNAIKKRNGYIIKIVRPNLEDGGLEHSSEMGIDDVDNYDFEIINDGTIEELHIKINDILERI